MSKLYTLRKKVLESKDFGTVATTNGDVYSFDTFSAVPTINHSGHKQYLIHYKGHNICVVTGREFEEMIQERVELYKKEFFEDGKL